MGVNKIRIGIFLGIFFIILVVIVLVILLNKHKNEELDIPFDNLSTCTASGISIPGWKLLPDSSGNCIAKKPQPKICCDNDYTYNNTNVCKTNFGESDYNGNINAINFWISNCISARDINNLPDIKILPDCNVKGITIPGLKHIPYEDSSRYMCFVPKPNVTCGNLDYGYGCCRDEYTYKNIDGYKYDFTDPYTKADPYTKEEIYKFMQKCNFTN